MSDFELSKRARKLQEEVTQRLTKLKSRGVKNPLKKLPGYGSQWFCRKRKDPLFSQDSNEDLNPPPPSLELDPSKITQFIKHLNPAVPPPAQEDSDDVIQGPGFEFPTEKEVQKCNKHWSKRFKHWQPETKTTNQPSSKPFSIRFKAPLPSNEVEVDGRRFRLVERKDEIEELLKTTHCISKKQLTVFDPKFYAEIVAEFGNAHFIRIATPSKEPDLALTDPEAQVTAVYAPLPLASKILTAMKKKLHSEGKGELADGLQVDLKKLEAQEEEEEEEEDDDEVQYPPSAIKKSTSSALHATPLEEGDEASVFIPKGPKKTVKIYCSKCKTQLYKYRKGGTGSLVKCWHERIVQDFTDGDLHCPNCGAEFARPAKIRGKPANKIIGGKVIVKK